MKPTISIVYDSAIKVM